MEEKLTIHYVAGDARDRAQFFKVALEIGGHCELYEDLVELTAYPPQQGIIVMKVDSDAQGEVTNALEKLEKAGIWLSVVIIGDAPSTTEVVRAIKAGALDYLQSPSTAKDLERCLSRRSSEDKQTSLLRRAGIEAKKMISGLTTREVEVLDLLAAGGSNKAIARTLGISPCTVEIHRSNMFNKLGASSAVEAIRMKIDAEQLLYA